MLPDYEKTRIPEGAYQFEIMSEPEKRKKTGQGGKEFVTILFKLKATDSSGEVFDVVESFLGFEDKYADLLIALGATENEKGRLSGQTIEPVGMTFDGDIIYAPDKNNPDKIWTKIVNIKGCGETAEEDDDIKPETKEDMQNELKESDNPVEEDDDDVPF